jgi:hypothetical protein
MRKLFLFFLVFVGIYSKAQNDFFKWFDTPDHEVAYDAVQTSQGEYLIVGEKGTNTYPLHSFILKISMDGYIVDEKEISNPSGESRIMTIDRLPRIDNRFLLTGARDSVTGNDYYSRLFLMIINDSMEILSLKEFSFHKNRLFTPWKAVILSDSLFYLLYSFDSIHNSHLDFDLAISKFKIPFDSLLSYHHEGDIPYYIPQDICLKTKDTTLLVAYFGSTISKSPSPTHIMKLSENLEFLSIHYGPQNLVTNVSFSPLNDSILYITGTNDIELPPTYRDIGCYLLNDTNRVVQSMEFYNNPDTLIYGGRGGHSLLTNSATSKTFITSHYNLDIEHYQWPTKPDWIQITRTDFALNIIDHHFYGGDASYVAHSMKPTTDGGTFLTGFRYDYNSQGDYQYDVFILKTDSAGRLTNVSEINNVSASEAILTPTPGSDHCFAILGKQYKLAQLQMYDMNGSIVIEQKLQEYKTTINTFWLSKGIYLYKISVGNKVIGSGKWIKN